MSALEGAAPGDAVLLHASCHNPTGGVLSEAQWMEIAALVAERGLLPLVDLAYQGLGRGLDQDVAGLRHLIGVVPEAIMAVSCSKSLAFIASARAPSAACVGRRSGCDAPDRQTASRLPGRVSGIMRELADRPLSLGLDGFDAHEQAHRRMHGGIEKAAHHHSILRQVLGELEPLGAPRRFWREYFSIRSDRCQHRCGATFCDWARSSLRSLKDGNPAGNYRRCHVPDRFASCSRPVAPMLLSRAGTG